MSQFLLEAKNISKYFSGLKALDNVSLHIESGEVYGLIGPNGAGKTTFFNCLTGFNEPDVGYFILNGRRLKGTPEYNVTQGIARTFQNIRLFKKMTVIDNILVGCHKQFRHLPLIEKFSRSSLNKQYDRCLHLMSYVDLPLEKAYFFAHELSYGEQRKLEIARALATQPIIIALDEPAAGMNSAERRTLKDLIQKIRQDNITVMLIEHDVDLVMDLCNRLAVLNFGKKIIEDTPRVVTANADFTDAYLGRDYDE